MQPVKYRGVPIGNLQYANRLTLGGSLRDVARYRGGEKQALQDAILGVRGNLLKTPFDASALPYHQELATEYYNVKLAGLGEGGEDDELTSLRSMSPGSAPSSGSTIGQGSGWVNVINTVFGNLSKAIGQRISGQSQVPLAPAGTTVPTWAIVGAAGLGALILLKVARS